MLVGGTGVLSKIILKFSHLKYKRSVILKSQNFCPLISSNPPVFFSVSGLKMATGRKNPRTRGHPNRWARIRARTCARGHGCGQRYKPNGHSLTGKKIAYPYPQTRLSYLTVGVTANQVYIGSLEP